MDLNNADKLFPKIKDKLAAPKRLSAFAKERQQAEAKKRESEAADAEALRSLQASFDADDDDDTTGYTRTRQNHSGPRHDGYNARSGHGRLGPAAGLMQPPSMKRKRALDELREVEAARREEESWTREDTQADQERTKQQKSHELSIPKPMIYLKSLHPGVTSAQVRAILSPYFTVQYVSFKPDQPRKDRKKTLSAEVTLAQDTTAKQIDTAVAQLSDRYVGCGFKMSAARLAANFHNHPMLNSVSDQPFGAQRSQQKSLLRKAPPPVEPGRFAPPDSYDRRGPAVREPEVDMDKHLDIDTVRAVHSIADQLLSEPDPNRALQLEALLMNLPEVQSDERFSFLYDSKSLAGVYYRYCLWKPDSHFTQHDYLFDDLNTKWQTPSKRMPYTDLTHLSHAVRDADYVSSDEESDDEEPQGPGHEITNIEGNSKISITPLQRARLTHLLGRLPTSSSRLRRGDIARTTNFALSHAASGIEEIVDMLLLNVEMPFSLTQAAAYANPEQNEPQDIAQDDEEYDPEQPMASLEEPQAARSEAVPPDGRETDPSNAKMVALYVISDILGAITSAEGLKNAWKFRQLFEQGFKNQKTFERLGLLENEYGWGKMKAEQWKRKVLGLLDMWEKSSAFGTDVVRALTAAFQQETIDEAATSTAADSTAATDKLPKWMTQTRKNDDAVVEAPSSKAGHALLDPESIRKKPKAIPNLDGAADDETELVEAVAMDEERPTDQSIDATESTTANASSQLLSDKSTSQTPQAAAPKKRMRAEDMFMDSDEDM